MRRRSRKKGSRREMKRIWIRGMRMSTRGNAGVHEDE